MTGVTVEAKASPESSTTTGASHHRTDIDGLRAIAVLSVLLAHAGFDWFPGGWVGVDVFFVISGFLITGLLLREHQTGTFSFKKFWMRRVRRILPALVLVVLLCFPFAWWLMFPDYIQNFGQSAVATMLSANNLLLAATSGYWDLDSAFKPLLHTWSLGVEEQFYIVYPLLFGGLILLFKRNMKALIVALAVLATLSLVAAQIGTQSHPDAAFYMPQYRAWELLAGALGAFVVPTGRRLERFLPPLGIAAILAAVFFFTPATPSPGAWLLIPVLGTVLVLVYGKSSTFAHGLLSLKPVRVVGLISYSAYLIHQPVFAFIRVGSLEEPSPWFLGPLILPILGASWLSWRFVEEPFRRPKRMSSPKVFVVLIPATAVILVAGLLLHVNQGFPARIFPQVEAGGDVHISYNERIRAMAIGRDDAPDLPDVVVVGNSFGRDAANVLLEADPTLEGRLAYYAPPSNDVLSSHDLAQLASVIRPGTVVVFAVQSQTPAVAQEIVADLQSLGPDRVYVFGTKDFGWNLNPYARVPVGEREGVRVEVQDQVAALNDDLASDVPNYIDIIRLLGNDGTTLPVFDSNGNPLTPDRKHLTRYGAQLLAERLAESGEYQMDGITFSQ